MPKTINFVSFNHDASCFSIATSQGFCIYNCDPFRELYSHHSDDAISVAEIINEKGTALVKVGSTDILIWNNLQNRTERHISLTSEIALLSYYYPFIPDTPDPREIKTVKCAHPCGLLLVVAENEIYMLDFSNRAVFMELIPTAPNPNGICCAVSSEIADRSSFVMVYPQNPREFDICKTGLIAIQRYTYTPSSWQTELIQTYLASLVTCLALSADGLCVAVATSSGGNSVRIFDTAHAYILQEFEIGEDEGEICSMAFSPSARWLVVSSDKGTAHVFQFNKKRSNASCIERSAGLFYSSLCYIKEALPMKRPISEHFARFRFKKGVRNIVAYGRHGNTVTIVGMDGSFYRCEFDPMNGGEMIQLEHHNFINKVKDN